MQPEIIFRTNIDCCQNLVYQLNERASLYTLGRVPQKGERVVILDKKKRLSLEVVDVTFKPLSETFDKKPRPCVEIELHLDYHWKGLEGWTTKLEEFIRNAY